MWVEAPGPEIAGLDPGSNGIEEEARDDVYCGSHDSVPTGEDGATTSSGYDADCKLWASGGGWAYEWATDGLMSRVLQNSMQQQAYTYDALGRRVKSTEPSGTSTLTTYFAYGGMNLLFTFAGTSPSTMTDTIYVYAAGLLVFRMSPYVVQYYHADHLGNVRLVTYYTTTVNTEFSARYKPFGEAVVLTDNAAVKPGGRG